MKSISILKHVYTFVQQVDKLDHLFNWSRLDLHSQGWAKEDAMSSNTKTIIFIAVSYSQLVQFSLQRAHDSIRKSIAGISRVSPLRISDLHVRVFKKI